MITSIKKTAGQLTLWTLALLMTMPASALELSDFVADTVSAHPEVREKLHQFREVVSDQQLAKSGYRPSIDLDASTGLYNTDSPATGNQSRNYNSSRLELSVTQNLFSGYDTDHQIEQNKYRASSALYDLYDTADNIALDAIKAYLEVLKQQRLLELATDNVNSHEGILSQIRERNNSGVGRASQLQQTEGRVARAHASLIAQQNNLQDALTLLHQILGRYVSPEELQQPDLPELPPDDLNTLIDQALQHHPAMKVAQQNINASREDYKRSRRTRYPDINLRLGSKWGDNLGGFDGETKELGLTLNLKYNFYNGGADKANQQKKISVVYERKEFAARVRRQIINTLRLARVADESLTRQLVYLQKHIEKSQQTVASYREEFFIGQRDLIDLLDAENELNTAQNEFTKAHYDAIAARYRVFEALGQLFPALSLDAGISEDDFTLARLQAKKVDKLPLPKDEDADNKPDNSDHCDNTLKDTPVNVYGCQQAAKVEMGYVHVNTAPSVGNDEVEVDTDGILAISKSQLLSNDTDVDGDVLTMVDVGRPNNGRLAFNKDGSLIYRPAEGYSGVDSFTYTVSDGNGAASTATVQINVRKTDGIDLSKMQYVNFKYNKTDLTNISARKVQKIIQRIREADDLAIEIRAYTDSIGSNAYNLNLSKRRANALKKLLTKEGIPASSISAIGMGEADPIADNATKAGQAINRRGEFVFKAKGVQ